MDSLFGFYMKNWFKRAYFEVSTTSEKFHYISRDLHLVNLDHCALSTIKKEFIESQGKQKPYQ